MNQIQVFSSFRAHAEIPSSSLEVALPVFGLLQGDWEVQLLLCIALRLPEREPGSEEQSLADAEDYVLRSRGGSATSFF